MHFQQVDGYWTRPGTNDRGIIAETRRERYVARLGVGPGDRVLDIGGHIGSAARLFHEAGGMVLTVEPDATNYRLLCRNVPVEVCTLRAAVIVDDRAMVRLWTNPPNERSSWAWSPAAHSLRPRHHGMVGVLVPAVSFQSLIDEWQPSHVKLDCEGSEYPLLRSTVMPGHVRHLLVEHHTHEPQMRGWLPELVQWLVNQRFQPDVDPVPGQRGALLVAWHRS